MFSSIKKKLAALRAKRGAKGARGEVVKKGEVRDLYDHSRRSAWGGGFGNARINHPGGGPL